MYVEREVESSSDMKDRLPVVIGTYDPYTGKGGSEGLSRNPTQGESTSNHKFDVNFEDSVLPWLHRDNSLKRRFFTYVLLFMLEREFWLEYLDTCLTKIKTQIF